MNAELVTTAPISQPKPTTEEQIANAGITLIYA